MSSTTATEPRPRRRLWPMIRGSTIPSTIGEKGADGDDDRRPRGRGSAGPPGARAGAPRTRPITFRVVGFIVLLVALVAGAFAAIGLYARGSYFVGVAAEQLTIYKGRPGGLLWFQPTLVERTNVTTAAILPSRLGDLQRGQQEATRRPTPGATSTTSRPRARPTASAPPRPPRPCRPRPPPSPRRPRRPPPRAPTTVPPPRPPRRSPPLRDGPSARPAPHRAGPDRARRAPDRRALHPGQPREGVEAARQPGPVPRHRLRPAAPRPPGHAPLGAARRPHPAAHRRAAERDRLRLHRPPEPASGRPAGHLDGPRHRRPSWSPWSWSAGPGISSATATPSPSSASACCCCRCLPVVGQNINGARLWVRLGSVTFQPGELAKIALAIFFASYMVERADLLRPGHQADRAVPGPRPPVPGAGPRGVGRCRS